MRVRGWELEDGEKKQSIYGFKHRQIGSSDSNHLRIPMPLPASADIVFTTSMASFANTHQDYLVMKDSSYRGKQDSIFYDPIF